MRPATLAVQPVAQPRVRSRRAPREDPRPGWERDRVRRAADA